jgi:hypothetical protein
MPRRDRPAVSVPAIVSPTRRDRALDVMRGIAIVVMTSSHVAPTSRINVLMHAPVWMSAADGFVLVSGATLGLRASRAAATSRLYGWLVRRSLVLWAVHCLLTLIVIAVHQRTGRLIAPEVAELGGWWRTTLLVGCLRVQPLDQMNILPMYVMFLLFAPIALVLLRRGQTMFLLLVSAAVWVGAQRNPGLIPLPAPTSEEMVFSLAAWQLAFIVGLVLGFHRDAIEETLCHSRPLLGRLGVCFIGIMFVTAQLQRSNLRRLHLVLPAVAEHWLSKQTWGGVHALYATGLLMLGYSLVRWWEVLVAHQTPPTAVRVVCDKLLQVFETVGRKSLRCFLLHLGPALLASAYGLQNRSPLLQELSAAGSLFFIYGVALVSAPRVLQSGRRSVAEG